MEINVPNLLRIKPNAMHKIGKYLAQCGYKNVALIYGEGIKEMFGGVINISFESADIRVLYESVVKTNNADEAFDCAKKIPKHVTCMVGIGGGKALDFCKYIAFVNQLPMFSVPTLVSNDGFCSPFSSMLVNGKRKTVHTKIPEGVVVDTAIIAKTPARFIYSGMGDLFCKITAVADWKLSYKKRGEYVNDFAADICTNAVKTFRYYPDKSIDNLEYLGIMISSLLMTGIAMEIAETSRPASGAEHMISHAYDAAIGEALEKNPNSVKPSIHGLQVGVASYFTSFLQGTTFESVKEVMKNCGFFDYVAEHEPLDRALFLEAFKNAPEVKEDYYTILSENDSDERFAEFLETDDWAKKLLK